MVHIAGVDVCSAVRMASLTPARMLGIDHEVGNIRRGKRANLVLFDDGIRVRRVIKAGQPVEF